MRFYTLDLTEVSKPYEEVQVKDEYADEPTHLRVYKEDNGDEWPWNLDGCDAQGRYTEALSRFATEREALDARQEFIVEIGAKS